MRNGATPPASMTREPGDDYRQPATDTWQPRDAHLAPPTHPHRPRPEYPAPMRRVTVLLASCLVLASCATRSDRVTEPVAVPTSLGIDDPANVGLGACTVTVGAGLGARVSEVLAGGAADGVLLPDDVVTAFGDEPIATAGQLVRAVQARRPGETVTVTVQRNDQSVTAGVTLGENPDLAGRAMLGVLAITAETRVEPSDLAERAATGALLRVATVDGSLFVLDPAGVAWTPLGVSAPSAPYLPLDGGVYTVAITAERTTAFTDVLTGTTRIADLQGWEPRTILTTMGNVALLGVEEIAADGTAGRRAVAAVEPDTGLVHWFWLPDPSVSASVPLVGYRSPDGDRAVVALTTPEDTSVGRYVVLSEVDGRGISVPLDVPSDAAILGWADADRVFAVSNTEEILLIDPTTGESVSTTIPVEDIPVGLWPVGDGSHVLVEEGNALILATLGTSERRLLTSACGDTVLGELGFAAG